ncbi:ABC transporter substrate-binding protein [Meiothermus ruber]|jgi:iron complex transport system substrate-binding protein|uniref:Periplasmic binding protein n=1 Tax=Meiothermus ruber (strain ATCC 35948 / DSM 1279 / VKM B-1258 / 21) TaxID=504728 RepID=D3PM71_MEIRD|nr:ABC transporter substrate-binding protein [Meiothermus ruber]ADD29177.1 periplasmic binding protein [Meiothermus ruber DSM 1279]AGK05373.1 periplasmic binding protein [Meiothermus ruber DSM 1279]MCL6528490.1 ABC transporter substrate-binding protein [Meiothermus ruber]
MIRNLMIVAFCWSLLAGAQTAYPLTIRHDAGETTIAKKPERVVALGEELLELLIPLGVKPVGYGSSRIQAARLGEVVSGLTYYSPSQLGPAIYVGNSMQPSLEAVLSLKPDLILVWGTSEAIEGLKKIAPVLAWEFNRDPVTGWRTAFLETARALNQTQQAQKVLRDYDAQMRVWRGRLAPFVAKNPRVTSLFLYNEQFTGVFGPKFNYSIALARLGFRLANVPGVEIKDGSYQPVSPEALATISRSNTDFVLYIRAKTPDGRYPELTSERVLKTTQVPLYRYELDLQEPQGGPITDLRRAEKIARLLLGR